MEVEVLKTDGYGVLPEVRVGDQVLGVMDAFSMIPPEHLRNAEPESSYVRVEGYSWEQMFSGNPRPFLVDWMFRRDRDFCLFKN